MNLLRLIARPMLAAPFVLAGFDAARSPEKHRERAASLYALASKFGAPTPSAANTDLITRATGGAMMAAGAALATGKMARLSAAVLALAEVPLALANNPFWEHSGEAQKQDLLGLASAAGLVGGALIASADRVGKPSLGWRASRKAGEISDAVTAKASELSGAVQARAA